ncbi:MAG: hypothetical protein EOP52_11360 [Sphingobacteriales bacterium]|nr:MAG: hypothetical protein EOP52_11360 [Sphingobacteriales bacterium]
MRSKALFGVCTAGYLLMLGACLLYFKERTVILDASYQLFHILAKDGFAIQVNRFGAAITQAFPLLGSRLGFSLPVLMQLYSAGFVLFYFAAFLFTWLVLRNQRLALVIFLFNFLMTTHSFFWIQCELVQGVVFTLLFLGLVERQLQRGIVSPVFWAVSPLLLITIVFFYPLLPFVLLFGLAFFALEYRKQYQWLLAIGLSYLLIYGIKVLFFKTDYDSNAMGGISNLKAAFPDYFTIQSNKNLARWMLKDYYLLPIAFALICIRYVQTRQFRKLSLFAVFFIGLTGIINIVNYQGTAPQFYLEPQYTILAVFIGFAWAYDGLPVGSKSWLLPLVAGIIVLLFAIRVHSTGIQYTARLDWFRKTAQTVPDKTVLTQADVPLDLLKMTWGSAFEWWLLSTSETGKTKSLIIEEQPGQYDWAFSNPKLLLTKWEPYNYAKLPPLYFVLKDTVRTYSRYQRVSQ